MTARFEVEVEDPAWEAALPEAAQIAAIAGEAALPAEYAGGVVVLLTDDAAVRALNTRFRGKDAATNVLSFPAPPNLDDHIGDIALSYGVCAVEAQAQGKTLAAHLQHLVAHGVLHLVGFDHETDEDAENMEARERAILAGLGVADPHI